MNRVPLELAQVQSKDKSKKKKKKKKKGFEMALDEEEDPAADVLPEAGQDPELDAPDSAAPAAERKPRKGKKTGFTMPADDAPEPPAAVADPGADISGSLCPCPWTRA